jgi:hypothetical protein
MFIELSITEIRVIRKLLVHCQLADVVPLSTNHNMTQANKEILMEKLFVAIEACACEARSIQ